VTNEFKALEKSSEGDLILEEVRRAKQKLGDEYGHNLKALFARIKERERRSSHKFIKESQDS
jgi:hypothetical protein